MVKRRSDWLAFGSDPHDDYDDYDDWLMFGSDPHKPLIPMTMMTGWCLAGSDLERYPYSHRVSSYQECPNGR